MKEVQSQENFQGGWNNQRRATGWVWIGRSCGNGLPREEFLHWAGHLGRASKKGRVDTKVQETCTVQLGWSYAGATPTVQNGSMLPSSLHVITNLVFTAALRGECYRGHSLIQGVSAGAVAQSRVISFQSQSSQLLCHLSSSC